MGKGGGVRGASTSIGDASATAALLKRIRRELQLGEISVQELVNQQADTLHHVLGTGYPEFEALVASFAFESALAYLKDTVPPE